MTPLDILYVDDDADIRLIVELSLRLDPAVTVRVAASTAEALASIAAGPIPDVALLDVMMPGADGHALLRLMRDRPDAAGIPVVFMTAKARATDMAGYRALGAIGVIVKPFDPLQLGGEVRALIAAHRRSRSPPR